MPMQFQLVGWSHYGFTNDAGKYVEGYKFHIVRESSSQNFNGSEATSVSVSEQMVQRCGEPVVNGVYGCTYDQRGRLAGYKLLKDPRQQKLPGV